MKSTYKEKDPEMPNYRTPMVEKLEKLSQKGYTVDFQYVEDHLVDLGDSKSYKQDQVKVVDNFRFEGITNPDDMAVLYVIETEDGKMGTIIDAFGIYGDPNLEAFINASVHNKDRPC
ncbi:hypothetical protein MYP_2055 [Sporocytophaga myxococcoides]|uniref:Phosphoribosylpyrophosphate synthetase n=1 Tax=Sporocytophaga myxococcoides TaxID=153721 RepID=A0A098LEH9_9BACT|nr:hypothetical protein [Sporocytophaga myxococcoides]GAL84827.1 hypothetical protein MYP_2055 [Sporocytophaga myxococcoides]